MSIPLDLSGRVVLVTGGGGGIGSACASRAAAAGAQVVLTDIDEASLAAATERAGPGARSVVADLVDEDACRRLVRDIVAEHGRLDHLIACAGIMQTKPLLELTEAEWRRVLDVNLTGTFLLVQAVGAAMRAAGSGSMVLFASVAARSGRPMAAHYAASKTAVLSLTQSAAMAFAPEVRVNALCPGVVLTKMWDQIIADRDVTLGAGAGEDYRRQVEQAAPLGRSGDVDEVAHAALFLLSDLASYITGQALNVDGGLEMD